MFIALLREREKSAGRAAASTGASVLLAASTASLQLEWAAPAIYGDRRQVVARDPDVSKSPVEPTERMGKHDRHDHDARTEEEHVLGLAEVEGPDSGDEQVADGQVEEPPKHVDRRGG